MYWAISLSQSNQNLLKRTLLGVLEEMGALKKYEEWTAYGDHVTIIHSTHKEYQMVSRILKNFEGHSMEFKVTALGVSESAVAFKVNVGTANKYAHITMLVAPGHNPVESNDITDWIPFYTENIVSGRLEERQ